MGSRTLIIEVPEDVADIAERRVEAGLASSISDAVAEGLRLLDDASEGDDDEALRRLRDRLDRSAASPARLTSDDVRRHFERLVGKAGDAARR